MMKHAPDVLELETDENSFANNAGCPKKSLAFHAALIHHISYHCNVLKSIDRCHCMECWMEMHSQTLVRDARHSNTLHLQRICNAQCLVQHNVHCLFQSKPPLNFMPAHMIAKQRGRRETRSLLLNAKS